MGIEAGEYLANGVNRKMYRCGKQSAGWQQSRKDYLRCERLP
jgi:hypothetical protein